MLVLTAGLNPIHQGDGSNEEKAKHQQPFYSRLPTTIATFAEENPGLAMLGATIDGRLASARDAVDDDAGGSPGLLCQLVWLDEDSNSSSRPELLLYASPETGYVSPSLPSLGGHDELARLIALPESCMAFAHLGPPSYSLGGLVSRISTLFPGSSQVGSTVQGLGGGTKLWLYPPTASAASARESDDAARVFEVFDDACVGVAIVIDPQLENEGGRSAKVAAMTQALARAVLRWTCHRPFVMTTDIQQRLFVPQNYNLGPQPEISPSASSESSSPSPVFLDAVEPRTIPVFVLDVCLFPGMDLPLRIFEPRYRCLVKDCIEKGLPFGLIHSDAAQEGLEDDEGGGVGSLVRIANLVRMSDDDGESQLVVRGLELFRLAGPLEPQPDLFGLATAPATALTTTKAGEKRGDAGESADASGDRSALSPELQNVAAEVLQQRILRLLPTEWKPYMQELATKRSPPMPGMQQDDSFGLEVSGQLGAESEGNEKNAAGEIQLHDMPPDEFAFLLAQWLASTGLCGPRIALSWMAQAGNTLDLLAKLNNFITQLGSESASIEK